MGRPISKMEGQRYGELTVIERYQREGLSVKNSMWKVSCSCGNTLVVSRSNLITGGTRSCGCKSVEWVREKNTKHGESSRGKATRLYNVWSGIKGRCYIKSAGNYKYYGGRFDNPITMCDEWRNDYTAFRDWALQEGWDENATYKDMLTLERIDNDGPYSPENTTLATWKEQHQNKREKGTAS